MITWKAKYLKINIFLNSPTFFRFHCILNFNFIHKLPNALCEIRKRNKKTFNLSMIISIYLTLFYDVAFNPFGREYMSALFPINLQSIFLIYSPLTRLSERRNRKLLPLTFSRSHKEIILNYLTILRACR